MSYGVCSTSRRKTKRDAMSGDRALHDMVVELRFWDFQCAQASGADSHAPKQGKAVYRQHERRRRLHMYRFDVKRATKTRSLMITSGGDERADIIQDEFAEAYTGRRPASPWSDLPDRKRTGTMDLCTSRGTTRRVEITIKSQERRGPRWSFPALSALQSVRALDTGA